MLSRIVIRNNNNKNYKDNNSKKRNKERNNNKKKNLKNPNLVMILTRIGNKADIFIVLEKVN